ncbi:MAG: hypothetical protein IPM80_02505 [Proteobacteria bacterium]|nr:hypothetical protein [Pseudomonadota bacterium]
MTSGQKSDTWFTADKDRRRIKKVHDYVAGIPGVGTVQSLASIVRVAEDLNKAREFDPRSAHYHLQAPAVTCATSSSTPYIPASMPTKRASRASIQPRPAAPKRCCKIGKGLQTDLQAQAEEFEGQRPVGALQQHAAEPVQLADRLHRQRQQLGIVPDAVFPVPQHPRGLHRHRAEHGGNRRSAWASWAGPASRST